MGPLLRKEKKESYTISQKQHALNLLGYCADDSKGAPARSYRTHKPQNPTIVAKEHFRSQTAIYRWMSKPHDIMLLPSKSAKQQKTLRGGEYDLIDHELQTYMIDTIKTTNGISPFRDNFIHKLALEFRDKIFKELDAKIGLVTSDSSTQKFKAEKTKLEIFKVISGLYYTFLALCRMSSENPRGAQVY